MPDVTPRPAFPISLYVSGRKVLVVGDGLAADERGHRLEEAGAVVERVTQRAYVPTLCQGAFLVVAHGTDPELDARIARDARRVGCLAYAHDRPDLSDFAMPAIARHGPVTVAISTSATAPALARRLREQLDALLATSGEHLDSLLQELIRLRETLPRDQRAAIYEHARRLTIAGHIRIEDVEDR